jgi:hypothetical protein
MSTPTDWGEGQVIASNGLGTRTRLLGDGGGDLAGIDRVAAMVVSEELARHLGADPRPKCSRGGIVSQASGRPVPRGKPFRHLDPERADLAGVNP